VHACVHIRVCVRVCLCGLMWAHIEGCVLVIFTQKNSPEELGVVS